MILLSDLFELSQFIVYNNNDEKIHNLLLYCWK